MEVEKRMDQQRLQNELQPEIKSRRGQRSTWEMSWNDPNYKDERFSPRRNDGYGTSPKITNHHSKKLK